MEKHIFAIHGLLIQILTSIICHPLTKLFFCAQTLPAHCELSRMAADSCRQLDTDFIFRGKYRDRAGQIPGDHWSAQSCAGDEANKRAGWSSLQMCPTKTQFSNFSYSRMSKSTDYATLRNIARPSLVLQQTQTWCFDRMCLFNHTKLIKAVLILVIWSTVTHWVTYVGT